MAHANLHIALGVGLGTAFTMPGLLLSWVRGRPVARAVGWMLVAAWSLGCLAIVPNILGFSGITGAAHTHVLADVFVLHRTVDLRIEDGGMLVGELALAAAMVFHYAVIVAAVVRAGKPR